MGRVTEGRRRGGRARLLAARGVALAVVMIVVFGVLAPLTRAASPGPSMVTVTTTGDPTHTDGCSLRGAIAYADGTPEPHCTGGSQFAPTGTPVTIVLPGESTHYTINPSRGPLTITGQVIIHGDSQQTTVIDGGQTATSPCPCSQIFSIQPTAQVELDDLTVSGGHSGPDAGYTLNGGSPIVDGSPGGGIDNAGTLTLNDVTVTGNATSAGMDNPNDEGDMGCTHCWDGGSGGDGGGIATLQDSSLTLNGSTVTGNATGAGGAGSWPGGYSDGAVYQGGDGGFGGDGGGIYSTGATVTIDASQVNGNSTGAGGGGAQGSWNGAGGFEVDASGGQGGDGGNGGEGGGIDAYDSVVTVSRSTIAANATGAGGGAGPGGALGARGPGGFGGDGGAGGGVDLDGPSVPASLSNDTITANQAGPGGPIEWAGGGVAGAGPGSGGGGGAVAETSFALGSSGVPVTLSSDTIADNTASAFTGGLFTESATLIDSILAGNTGNGANGNCDGVLGDGGGNVIFGADGGCPSEAGDSTADPKLAGALGDNGGPVPTLAITTGSAAIGAASGCAAATDARGISRRQDHGCDAGAYEYAPPTVAAVTTSAVNATTADLTAMIDPDLSDQDTSVAVRYGLDTVPGDASAAQDLGRGGTPVAFRGALTGLASGATYHYEVVATNGDGTTVTGLGSFTTPANSPVPTTSPRGAGRPLGGLSSATAIGSLLRLRIACAGTSGSCDGSLVLTSHVTLRGTKVLAVAAVASPARSARPRRVTRNETVGGGHYSVAAGTTKLVRLALDKKGRTLLAARLTLPATLTVGGAVTSTRRVTFTLVTLKPTFHTAWSVSDHGTGLRRFTITGITRGSVVTAICHGAGCPFVSRSIPVRHSTASLAGAFANARLSARATLEIEVTHPGEVGRAALYSMRTRDPPKLRAGCLAPRATHASACPR